MNKPVAWMLFDKNGSVISQSKTPHEGYIPLYTHPVKENCCPDCGCHFTGEYPFNYTVKELTDEEIMDIKTLMEINYGCVPPLEFAWAILRKAQEK